MPLEVIARALSSANMKAFRLQKQQENIKGAKQQLINRRSLIACVMVYLSERLLKKSM
jgi:hypothetical protein